MADMLPRFFALQYGGKYLRYVVDDDELRGCLQFSGDEIATPYTRFEVVKAENSKNMVHIRCCYNRKFWMMRSDSDKEELIKVGANDPEEDQSKWSCTLIAPRREADDVCSFSFPSGLSFRSTSTKERTLSLNGFLAASTAEAAREAGGGGTSFTLVNMEDHVVLPRYVVFKRDNDHYLRSVMIDGHEYLEFDHKFDEYSFVDPEVWHETFPTSDGNVRIKSVYFNKFWRRDDPNPNDWVWADSTDTSSSNKNTVFKAVDLWDDNKIGLKCLGNNLFCIRRTADGKWDCLDAKNIEPGVEGRIRVEEAVVAREIYDIQFKLVDARTSQKRILTPIVEDLVNDDPDKTLPKEKGFSIVHSQKNAWTSTNSWKLGVSTTISTGIPFFAAGEISIETEYAGSIVWSETKEVVKTYQSKIVADVSPLTKQVITLTHQEANADIPFSYTQRDTLLDGTVIIQRMDDGLYMGTETIVSFTSKPVPLT